MTGYTKSIATAIWYDTRKLDKRYKRDNNLSKQFIEDLIELGCRYCGETNLRMTLDRKDNSIGHTVDNVIPACIRCNNIRRDMPFAAWIQLSAKLRDIKADELFGSWVGGFNKS